MQRAQEELKELFRPTARCFKGFTILLLIWGVASLLICALVPTIILVHNPLTQNGRNVDFGYADEIPPVMYNQGGFQSNLIADPIDPKVIEERREKAQLLRWITLGLGAGMLGVSAINYIMFVNYRKKEESLDGMQ